MTTKSRPLLDADYSAIEARIVNWLAGQEDALERFRRYDAAQTKDEKDRFDPYRIMATDIYGIPLEQVQKMPHRFVGKQATLGCGYGMGPAKFRGTCESYKYYDLPQGLEEKVVAIFRAKHPKVKSYWYLVENAAKRAIAERGTIVTVRNVKFLCKEREGLLFLHIQLPSGRQLSYPKPRVRPGRKFENTTEIVYFGHILGTKWGDVPTYGGKLVENITQAVAADVMAQGTLNCERAGYETATLIHDQNLSYYHPEKGQTVEEFVRLLTTLPKWAEGLPLEAEGALVPFYKKD